MLERFDPYISPHYKVSDFPEYKLEDKIFVFEDRIFGWIFDVCEKMYAYKIPYIEFAILKIICSCFELLGKHIKGYEGNKDSSKYFEIGFHSIYYKDYEKRAADLFYHYIRNPIFHSGFVTSNVWITENIEHAFGYAQKDILKLNIPLLLEDLKSEFKWYISDLRNKNNQQLRENFEKRFDFEAKDLKEILSAEDESEPNQQP